MAKANSRPLNHLTIIFETVMPAISIPTPNMAYPTEAHSTWVEITAPKIETLAPPKSLETAQYLMATPTTMMPAAITPVKRTPILSRIIPPKININRKTLNQPYALVKNP